MRLPSLFVSNMGKSTTQRGAQQSLTCPKSSATLIRSAPIASFTTLALSAPKKMISPVSAPSFSSSASTTASGINLRIGDCKPSNPAARSLTLTQANPLAPYIDTYLVYSSIDLRLISTPPGTRRATTRLSASLAGPLKTLKSTSFIKSAMSTSSRSIRRSGLSEP